MSSDPHIVNALRAELSDRDLWQTRVVVLTFGTLSGLVVVAFTWLTEQALELFHHARAGLPWLPLLWTPLCTAAVVWTTRQWAPGAAGSGIPQVMAALHEASRQGRHCRPLDLLALSCRRRGRRRRCRPIPSACRGWGYPACFIYRPQP